MPTASFVRRAMDIPTEPTPERHFRASHTPKTRGPKALIVKVQVPYTGSCTTSKESRGPLLVYTKKRDFVCHIRREDGRAEYDRISHIVRTQGVGGAKAYFAAELEDKEALVVKVSEVLAAQPW